MLAPNPRLNLSYTTGGTSTVTEEVKFKSKVALYLNAIGAPGDQVAQWRYTIDDPNQRSSGAVFSNPPRLKLRFEPDKCPDLKVEVITHWSTLANGPTNRSIFLRPFPRRRGQEVKSVFTNLINKVSISAPLDRLKGQWRVRDPSMEASTTQSPSNRGDVVQCQATDEKDAVDRYNHSMTLKVLFECALQSQLPSLRT
jgi:hypothetical protein